VRRHAKAPSAGSIFGIGDSRRPAALLVALGVCFCLLTAVASAAPKTVTGAIGTTGTAGGQLTTPRGVAVNQASGDIYVVDSGNNRIERFSSAGAFIAAWGQDVDSTTVGTGFEVCTAASLDTCKAGITTATTANGGDLNAPQGIAIDQSTGAVYVTDQGNRRIQKYTASGEFTWAAGWDVTTGGVTTFETCAVAANCKTAVAAGAGGGQFAAAVGYPAVDPVSGNVYVADTTNLRIQKFSSAGAFVSTFGFDVDATTPGTGYEICPAADTCKIGATGSAAGQFGGEFGNGGPTRVAVDGGGSIYTVESASNFRVQKFNPSATSPSVYAPGQIAGTETATPTDVAVDPSNEHVYVVKTNETPAERRVLEFDNSATLVETHASGAGIAVVNGLAVKSGGSPIYLSTTTGASQVLALTNNAVPAPTATIAAASAVTASTATLNGGVNPTGMSTGYHFEYSINGTTWTKAPLADAAAGSGAVEVPVTQAVTGLQASTLYHVRLAAIKAFGGGVATSGETTFTTEAAAPGLSGVAAEHVGETTAKLVARINPQNQNTTYRFEYGPTASYGTSTPIPDGTISASAGSTVVSQTITGLGPASTYHFRLVAKNTTGEPASVDQSFTTTATPPPPGISGYELVSPADGLNYDFIDGGVWGSTGPSTAPHSVARRLEQSAPDGSRIALSLGGPNSTLPGMVRDGGGADPLIATRTSHGWEEKTPLADRTDCAKISARGVYLFDLPAEGNPVLSFQCQRDRTAISPLDPVTNTPLDQQPDLSSTRGGLYSVDPADDTVDYLSGAFDLAGPKIRTDTSENEYLGSAPDGSITYFATKAILVPGISSPGGEAIYRVTSAGGAPTLVTKLPNGSAFGVPATPAPSPLSRSNAISSDGTAVTFGAPGSAQMVSGDTDATIDVYQVRMTPAGDQVVWASKTAFTGTPQTAANKLFEGASANGSKVFFSTAQKMVGDGVSTGDLDTVSDIYVYDENAVPGQELSRVTVSDPSCASSPGVCNDNASNAGTSPSAAKFSNVSDDGSHVVFVSGDVLNPNDTDGQQSLYVRDLTAGTTTYLAPAGAGVTSATNGTDAGTAAGSLTNTSGARMWPDMSTDGKTIAFLLATNYSLPAGRGGVDADGARDLFVWRQGQGVRRIRQGLLADDNTANEPSLGCERGSGAGTISGSIPLCRGITPDGSRLFSQMVDSLSSEDTDGGRADIYSIDTATGDVSLVTPPGGAQADANFIDNSVSGNDVFFSTKETLDPSRDTDEGHIDVYDARVGSILPPLESAAPPCDPLAETCQPPSASPPSLTSGQSLRSSGVGNEVDEPSGAFSVKSLTHKQRVALAKGRTVAVSVTVNRSGLVKVSGRARVDGQPGTVLAGEKEASLPGAVKVPVALTAAGRKALEAGAQLKISLRIVYSEAPAPIRRSLILKRPSAGGHGGGS